ncbi:MAG: type II toxin-antitoxin system Phd/YefM family antitoxin [Terracidiphilus sp.]|jgi:prevent-host-death family protein
MVWQVYDAKARFSELLDATLKEGPQMLTRRGVETAVLVPIDEWKRLKSQARPSLKEILLDPGGPRFEDIVPPRGENPGRLPVEFE